MPRKMHKPEEIVAKLRQVDVLASQGQSMVNAAARIGCGFGRKADGSSGSRR